MPALVGIESIRCKIGTVKLRMESSRTRQQKRQGFKPFDRRVDKWIETGRQFVDGVSGTRPGMRRINQTGLTGSSLEKAGRWMSDKLDWLLEDEDSWMEPWQSSAQIPMSNSGGKRPLEAISRRTQKQIKSSNNDLSFDSDKDDEWPDESSFRVDRWKRSQNKEKTDFSRDSQTRDEVNRSSQRPLPRSSRRR